MTKWEKYEPAICPWCGSSDQRKDGHRGGMKCNNSWHLSHRDHDLMWPTWREVAA